MNVIQALNTFGKRCLAWPALGLGMLLTEIARGFLHFAGWIMDYSLESEDEA